MKTPADVAVTAEAFEFDRCIMARRVGQVLPFSKSAKDSCVQHLAILAAGLCRASSSNHFRQIP